MLLTAAVQMFAEGIAFAEGFFAQGSRAARNHNPGNLTLDTIGKAISTDGPFVVYANDVDGWEALRKQVQLILTDASKYYNSQMTLRQIGEIYASTSTPNEQLNWAINVASKLGIDIDTPVSTLITTAVTNIGFGVLVVFMLLWYFNKGRK